MMDQKEKKSVNQYIRAWHRDIGFFVIGLTMVFCISGIFLIFRDTDFLKQEILIEKLIEPNLEASELAAVLHMKNFKVQKNQGAMVYFEKGSYNKTTGNVTYLSKELPGLLSKFNNLHKSSSRSFAHWFTLIYGFLLLFLALSSFWMFKARTKLFRRGIYIAGIGFVVAIVLALI